jgi:uncharacterized membrane protein
MAPARRTGRRELPAPERLTLGDIYRGVLGGLGLVLGVVLFVRSLEAMWAGTVAPLGLLLGITVGVALCGFGAHRLALGWRRYRAYRVQRAAPSRRRGR